MILETKQDGLRRFGVLKRTFTDVRDRRNKIKTRNRTFSSGLVLENFPVKGSEH